MHRGGRSCRSCVVEFCVSFRCERHLSLLTRRGRKTKQRGQTKISRYSNDAETIVSSPRPPFLYPSPHKSLCPEHFPSRLPPPRRLPPRRRIRVANFRTFYKPSSFCSNPLPAIHHRHRHYYHHCCRRRRHHRCSRRRRRRYPFTIPSSRRGWFVDVPC